MPWEPTALPWCPAGVGGTFHGNPFCRAGCFFPVGSHGKKKHPAGSRGNSQYLACFPRELPLQPVVFDIYARGNQRLIMMVLSCRRRTGRGGPWDPMGHTMRKPVGLPGNFEGIPAEPYGMPWGSGPGRSRGNYWDYSIVFSRGTSHGLPWESHGFPWGVHGFPWESHGFPWESHGFPREPPDSHGKSHNNVNRYIPVPAGRTSIYASSSNQCSDLQRCAATLSFTMSGMRLLWLFLCYN